MMNSAKSIPKVAKFHSVIIYASALIVQNLVVFPSCTRHSESQRIKKLTSWLWVTQQNVFPYMLWTGNTSWQDTSGTNCLHHKGEEL